MLTSWSQPAWDLSASPGIPRRWRSIAPIFWYAIVFAAGVGLLWRASAWGIGIRIDSLSYLTAAQNLSEGGCLCRLGSGLELKPLAHFGPLYPALVAVMTRGGLDVLAAARVVAAVLYGANLVMSGLFVHVTTRRFWAGAVGTILFGASHVVVEAHESAMSEPLFFFLFLAGFLALAEYLRTRRTVLFVLSLAASALALLTRYVGGSVLLAGMVALILLGHPPLRRRLGEAAIYGGGAFLPTGIWLARNFVTAGTFTNRVFQVHPVTGDDAKTFLDTVTLWLTTEKPSHWLEGTILLALLAGAAWLMGRHFARQGAPDRYAAGGGLIMLIFAAIYIPLLAASLSFFDASTAIEDRILSPWYVSLALVAAVALALLTWSARGRWIAAAASLLFLVGPARYVLSGGPQVLAHLQQDGVGFSSRQWQESDSVDWVRRLPSGATVYSNQALVLQLLLGRPAYLLPETYDSVKALPRSDYEDQLAQMRADLERPDSFLLVFNPLRTIDPSSIPLDFTQGLVPIQITGDGIVYARP